MSKYFLKGIFVALCLSLVGFVSSCDDDDDDNFWYGNDASLVVADLRMEVNVSAPETIEIELDVDKGRESDIYRDERLVSRGNYDGHDEYVSQLNTVFTHRGKAMRLKLDLDLPGDQWRTTAVPVEVEVKVYRNNELVDTFTRTANLLGPSVEYVFPYFSR